MYLGRQPGEIGRLGKGGLGAMRGCGGQENVLQGDRFRHLRRLKDLVNVPTKLLLGELLSCLGLNVIR